MKRNCRRTDDERDQHDRATRIRKMTDAQISSYIESGVLNPYPEEVLLLAQLYGAPQLCNHYCLPSYSLQSSR